MEVKNNPTEQFSRFIRFRMKVGETGDNNKIRETDWGLPLTFDRILTNEKPNSREGDSFCSKGT